MKLCLAYSLVKPYPSPMSILRGPAQHGVYFSMSYWDSEDASQDLSCVVYGFELDRKYERPFDGLTVPIDAEMSTRDHMMRVEHNGGEHKFY